MLSNGENTLSLQVSRGHSRSNISKHRKIGVRLDNVKYKVGPYLVVNEVITRISRVITPVTHL